MKQLYFKCIDYIKNNQKNKADTILNFKSKKEKVNSWQLINYLEKLEDKELENLNYQGPIYQQLEKIVNDKQKIQQESVKATVAPIIPLETKVEERKQKVQYDYSKFIPKQYRGYLLNGSKERINAFYEKEVINLPEKQQDVLIGRMDESCWYENLAPNTEEKKIVYFFDCLKTDYIEKGIMPSKKEIRKLADDVLKNNYNGNNK
jgi:hypothetical protein